MGAQPAGLRTHMLVCLGSALFTLTGAGRESAATPTRIAAQVVDRDRRPRGGAILREGATVRGLTTAASLWVNRRDRARGRAALVVRRDRPRPCSALTVLWWSSGVEREVLPHRRVLSVTVTLGAVRAAGRGWSAEVKLILPRSRVLRVSYTATGQALVFSSQAAQRYGADLDRRARSAACPASTA